MEMMLDCLKRLPNKAMHRSASRPVIFDVSLSKITADPPVGQIEKPE